MKKVIEEKKPTLVSVIVRDINLLSTKIDAAKKKLEEDFIYNFSWGYCGELYFKLGKSKKLNQLLNFIVKEPHRAIEWLEHNIGVITERTLKGNFMGTSTSLYSNLSHTYDLEIDCELLSSYKQYLECLKEDKYTVN